MTNPSKDQSVSHHNRICEYGSLTISSRLPDDMRANAMERGDKLRFIRDDMFDNSHNSNVGKKMTSGLCEIRCI